MLNYKGKVIRSDSLDPNYKVIFSFSTDRLELNDGVAFFARVAPFPKVSFDDFTDYLMEKLEIDENTLQNLRLEIGKTVFDYILDGSAPKK